MPKFRTKLSRPDAALKKQWNKTLSNAGLSMHAGDTHHMFVKIRESSGNEDHDLSLFTRKKFKVGSGGGRLPGYRLGYRLAHSKICKNCEWRFTSKRKNAIFCHKTCAKHSQRWAGGTDLFCLLCIKPLKNKRLGAKFCSDSCRLRRHRLLKAIETDVSPINCLKGEKG